MVFQSYALYPHMTVASKTSPSRSRWRSCRKAEIEPAVREAARKVKIDHLLDRKPGQLSGGQQQRCALARAIVRKARLFLLDEPLSNLDAKLRLETRAELKKLQRSLGVTAVYVTHDQEEAMTLADRMAVFMAGRDPADRHARGSVRAAELDRCRRLHRQSADEPDRRPAIADGSVRSPVTRLKTTLQDAGERDVIAGIRPGAVRLVPDGLKAKVDLIEDLGDTAVLDLDCAARAMRARVNHEDVPREGDLFSVTARPQDIHLFDPDTRKRL